MMTSDELRAAFLSFFESKGHKIIPSSSLIPQGDPTLLLTTAGMVQIKPYFLGEAVPPSPRLASCQKCFRTTDIESVGDATHLTFFEMLGNFSVGDYFKQEAIGWAWEFVTQRLRLPPERLWITIFLDDDDAFDYWRQQGVPEERILRFGEKDNFWGPAGDSGPCGPCSEIHYDFGEEVGCKQSSCAPGCDCGRFSEIWNLVFTQYNQDKDGRRTPLPKPNIDTGLGLERIAAVMQGKTSVYETDLFTPLLECVATLAGKKYGTDDAVDNAIRVIAEHSRGIAFLIGDGVMPSNEGRGYVLRRLLRRAALFGRRLGLDEPFLAETAKVTIEQMGHVYPELIQRQDFILKVVELEEGRFEETLSGGLEILAGEIAQIVKATKEIGEAFRNIIPIGLVQTVQKFGQQIEEMQSSFLPVFQQFQSIAEETQNLALKQAIQQRLRIPGKEAFRLYDTYGFPIELTKEIVSVDMEGFEKEMEKQRERARAAHKFGTAEKVGLENKLEVTKTTFTGYSNLAQKTVVLSILVGNDSAGTVKEGQEASLVLDTTPFYGEMGGQLGDTGEIRNASGRFSVTNTVRITPDIIVHQGRVTEGSLSVGDEVEAEVDKERRLDIARNHTATHLLQVALRQVLGEHIQQRGSLVAPDRLRFDFSHLIAMTKEQIGEVQRIVNDRIRQNLAVYDEEVPYKKAIEAGAIALFDEKYSDVVRVLRIGKPPISAELCGGTHVTTTGEIGFFHIISESSIGAGLRRIEAVTGRGAEQYIHSRLASLENIARLLSALPDEVENKVASTTSALDMERKQVQALRMQLIERDAKSLVEHAEVINGVNVLVKKVVESTPMNILRAMGDILRDRLGSGVIVLGTVYEDKPAFVAMVTPDLVARGYNAGEIVKQVAGVTGGGGGGKPTIAQAGGKHKDKLDEALRLVKSLI